jgi:hypothetical protein
MLLPTALVVLIAGGCNESGNGNDGAGRRVVLSAEEVHEGWFFASGDQVMILGTVNGDVYVAGGTVRIDGTVNGDVLAAGGTISINGTVTDDLRAAGGNIECNGSVGKNVSIAGGSLQVTKDAEIGGGLLAAGGEIHLGGSVQHDVMVTGGEAQLSGLIGGNVKFSGGGITTIHGARIQGGLQAVVANADRAQIDPGTVDGTVEITVTKPDTRGFILGLSPIRFWLKLIWALSLIVSAIVLILLTPVTVGNAGQTVWLHPWWCLLLGFAGFLLTPIVAVALCATFIGLPLGLFLLTLYFWFLYLSQMILGVVVGQRVFMPGSTGRFILAAVAGIILVQVLTFVPYLGILVIVAGLLLGLGSIIDVLRRRLGPDVKMSPPIV